jgi:HlyD family secretion protein
VSGHSVGSNTRATHTCAGETADASHSPIDAWGSMGACKRNATSHAGWLCAPLLPLTLLFVTTVGCGKKAAEDTPSVLVSVQVIHPERGAISDHVLSDAVLSPLAQAALSPRISVPVRRFYVQRGSHVQAGQLLVVLENRDLQAAALDTKGTYTAAEAGFDSTKGALVPDETQRSRLDVAQALATRDLDASIVAARQKLFEQGAIPGRDLDISRATLVQAQAAYDVAAKHLQSLEAVSRQATLDQSEGAMLSAKGKYLGAQAQVSYSEMRSPIKGVVTDRPLFAGETAAAGAPLVTVMDTTSMLAKVHLAQSAAQGVKVGDAATVTLPGVADPLPARVTLVSPALDPGSTTLEIWLRLDNRNGMLKAGTPVHTSVTGRTVANALLVPAMALLTGQDGGKYVMLMGQDSAAHKRAVKVGITDGDNAQIVNGLQASDTVITDGAYGLDDGTKVKVGAPESGDDAKPSPGGKGPDKGGL